MNESTPMHPILHFEVLRKEARTLLYDVRRNNAVPEKYRQFEAIDVSHARLSDAQYVVARRYGFKSWSALKTSLAPRFGAVREELSQSNQSLYSSPRLASLRQAAIDTLTDPPTTQNDSSR